MEYVEKYTYFSKFKFILTKSRNFQWIHYILLIYEKPSIPKSRTLYRKSKKNEINGKMLCRESLEISIIGI